MKRRNGWFLIVCVVALLAVIVLEPSYGWKLRSYLTPQNTFGGQGDNPDLAAENEVLSAELAKLTSINAELPKTIPNYLRAMVYSRYPFNFKNEFLTDAGTDEGVTVGKAVVFQGILIGDVEQAFLGSSLVSTVFDNDFKMPVRIGTAGYDGLLVGGSYPTITSIEKAAPLAPGDIVYTADPRFPYGLPVGTVVATGTSADGLFEEASLGFAYDINGIQTVLIAE